MIDYLLSIEEVIVHVTENYKIKLISDIIKIGSPSELHI